MLRRSKPPRLPHPGTDLRVVYWREDPGRIAARALADLRGDDDVVPGESEAFAATALLLSRRVPADADSAPGSSPFPRPAMERRPSRA